MQETLCFLQELTELSASKIMSVGRSKTTMSDADIQLEIMERYRDDNKREGSNK